LEIVGEGIEKLYLNENTIIFLDYIYSQLRCTILLADLAETSDPETATH
jgi:hypothetical protein